MIGFGIGVVFFWVFLQECEVIGVLGCNWLFFGEQYFCIDFFYQIEWQCLFKSVWLIWMDIVFLCDQEEKIYVQYCLFEYSYDIYVWFEEGVSFYVCGDVSYMVFDVYVVLFGIIVKEGQQSQEQVKVYLYWLQQEKCYQCDVY